MGGILIYYLKWFWLDPFISTVIALIILIGTWQLLKDSLRLSLDGVPADIDMNEIKLVAGQMSGVKDFHHIHIWAISTNENALTAHLVLSSDTSITEEQRIKNDLKHVPMHINIHHITLETEREIYNMADC